MDDAGVYQLTEDLAIVQTVDFFTPMVDDPYAFGQIAAANSLSDIYAMGAKPITAMNVVSFPVNSLDITILKEILAGGADKLREANTALVGGHTVEDPEPKYGLAVTGIIHPGNVLANLGTQLGDLLVLTKPLGTGIIATAIKGGLASLAEAEEAIASMALLNKYAAEALIDLTVHACTDVTGFGLIGHAYEMLQDAKICINLEFSKLPLLAGTIEYAQMGIVPAGACRNRQHYGQYCEIVELNDVEMDIFCDPQTSGGLLVALAKKDALTYLARLEKLNIKANIIGWVDTKSTGKLRLLK